MLPNFLVCGAQKSGTTSLHAYLRQHPQIYLPEKKELNYFNLNWSKSLAWYEAHFNAWSGQEAAGEVSPLYLWHPETAERIAETLPAARLIFILRNPIDRAFSNYWFNVARGAQNPNETFSEVIRTQDGQWRYLSKGLYAEQLSRYGALFPSKSRLVLYTEDLKKDPQSLLRAISEFLSLESNRELHVGALYNTTQTPRNPWMSFAWGLWVANRQQARQFVPPRIASATRRLRQSFHRLVFQSQSPSPMAASDRDYLRCWFAADVANLREMLGEPGPWTSDFFE